MWAAVGVVAVGLVMVAVTPMGTPAAVTLVALGLMAIDGARNDEHLVWWWAFLLPLDVIDRVPGGLLDVARYGGLAWLCLRYRPTISGERRPILQAFVGLAALVALVRLVGSAGHSDRFGMEIAAMMLVAAVATWFVAVRVQTHVIVVAGYLGGVLFSAVVALTQALDLPTIRAGNQEGSRFPGLSSATSVFSWQLAFALMIAAYFLWGRHHNRWYRTCALAAVPVTSVALVVNGAQGGLLALAAAGLAVGAWGWRSISWRKVAPYLAGAVGLVVVAGAALLASGIETPTVDGLLGKGGYQNERARWEAAADGWDAMVANPLTGVGRSQFEDDHGGLFPHFLPLEAGVTAGIVGFVTAGALILLLFSVVVRGPVGRRPAAWLGLALCAGMSANALTSAGGPLVGLPAFTMLLVSVLACRGEPWPADERPREEAPSPQAPSAVS